MENPEEFLKGRLTETKIKNMKGDFFNPQLVDITIPAYELSPDEAQELNKQGYVLKWIHKDKEKSEKPDIRLYELIGRNEKVEK